MSKIRFDLGSRGLTEAEAVVVEKAKARLIDSLKRHGKDDLAHLLATAPRAKAAAKPAAKKAAAKTARKVTPIGSDAWTSNKVAASIRKY